MLTDKINALFATYDVHAYVADYEFRGDGDYTPNETEKLLIEDAVAGAIGDLHEKLLSVLQKDAQT